MRSLFIAIAVCMMSATGAVELAGSEDAEFKQAVVLWLQNDDETSLHKLAQLARDGSVAARLLLARIERLDRAPSLYLESLSRERRMRLFRSAKGDGPFYSSWIVVEAGSGHPLASALQRAGSPRVDIDAIEQLIAFGERQATDHLVRVAALYGGAQIHRRLLANGLALDELRPFILSQEKPPQKQADGLAALRHIARSGSSNDWLELNMADADTMAASLLLSLGIPFGYVEQHNKWRRPIERWLLHDNAMRPVANMCSAKCLSDVSDCAVTVLGLTGGYYEAIRLDSPLESVIPQSRFLDSLRAQEMALRRAALVRAEDARELASIESIAGYSRCLADLVEIERENSRY